MSPAQTIERPTDAIDRGLKAQSATSQFLGGGAALILGMLLSRLVSRGFERTLPKPPPSRPLHPALLLASFLVVIAAESFAVQWLRPAAPVPAAPAAALAEPSASERAESVPEPEPAAPVSAPSPPVASASLAAPPDLHRMVLTQSLVSGIFLLFLIGWTVRFKQGLPELGLQLRHFGTAALFAVVFYVAFLPGFYGASSIEYGFWTMLGRPPPHQAAVEAFARDPAAQRDLFVLAGIVLIIPLFEELAFRGVLQHFLTRWLGGPLGIVATAAGFTLLHDASRLSVFALGLALCWLRARTGSLLASLCFHALHNGFALVMIASTGPE